jgi:hypothetical protein
MNLNNIKTDRDKMKILSRVVAHLMGDGCVTNRYFSYYNKNEYLLEKYEEDIQKLFGNVHIIHGKVNSGTSLVQVQNKPILEFLRSLIKDYRSFSLEYPKFLDDLEFKKEFLRSIYDDEGTVSLRVFKKTNEIKRNLTIASKSKRFIEDIKDILEKDFNILCNRIGFSKKRMGDKEFVIWYVSITGKENFILFRDKINFNHPLKKEKLDLMINSYIRK